MSQSDFFDLRSLFGFRESLNRVGSTAEPHAALAGVSDSISSRRVGILPGSFNPPTSAHFELAVEARERFRLDRVVFSLSSVIVDKEHAEGLCHEDRLLLLGLMARDHDWLGSAVTNRGLYYEQVIGFRRLFGKQTSIYFIVGMDKVLQIFDPKYYEDRDSALKTLFFEAQLIAANRAEWGADDLRTLLDQQENRAYEGRVYPLALPPSLKDLSSTEIRRAAGEGALDPGAVPDAVAQFIAATSAFQPGYELRPAAIRLLYELRAWAEDHVDFADLLARARENTPEGRSLREALAGASGEQLKELLTRH